MPENRRSSMKTRLRPFFQNLQSFPHKVYKHLSTKPLPASNPLWLQARTWEPVLTPEQEDSYTDNADESWVNSKPKGDVLVRVLSAPPEQEEPWVTNAPRTPVEKEVQHTLMHIFDESIDIGLRPTLLLPSIKIDKHFVRAVSTTQPDALRRINATDPLLPSTRMTPNHEFAIVPRRAHTQLPPRLGDDTADSPEHVTPVETLINAKIAEFHVNEQRLPHGIKVSFIRFCQHWITTSNYKHFTYKGVPIPITSAVIGEFAVNEVRLD